MSVSNILLPVLSLKQFQSMKRIGNVNANRTFNPQNTKPPIPLDVDEVDAVLERFIRQKYDQQLFSGGQVRSAVRNNTGSTRSSDDQPPPLPPKPGKRFGFGLRSASSALPLSRNSAISPPQSPQIANGWGGPPSPVKINKQSRIFGASVGGGGSENMDAKLAQLRDMGFADDKRNVNVLKGLGGNLERTIESLVRLGEGNGPGSRARTPIQSRNIAVSQPISGMTSTPVAVNGISFASNASVSHTDIEAADQQASRRTIAPMEQPAQRSFSMGHTDQTQKKASNPFGIVDGLPSPPQLENAFQSMQISPQPLFPNATGGHPRNQIPSQDARSQTMTPPVPQIPQQYSQPNPYMQQNFNNFGSFNPFDQTTQQTLSASQSLPPSNLQTPVFPTFYNPFQEPASHSSPQMGYSMESPQTYSPYTQQGAFEQQPILHQNAFQHQAVQQSTQQPFQMPPYSEAATHQQQQPQANFPTHQLFPNPSQSVTHNQNQPQALSQYQTQPLQPQQTGKVDKSSILALYNYPQLAPPPWTTISDHPDVSAQGDAFATELPPSSRLGQRSATMPISSGSRNPFQAAAGLNVNGQVDGQQFHLDSADVGGMLNGRHSPDAFASLSARSVR